MADDLAVHGDDFRSGPSGIEKYFETDIHGQSRTCYEDTIKMGSGIFTIVLRNRVHLNETSRFHQKIVAKKNDILNNNCPKPGDSFPYRKLSFKDRSADKTTSAIFTKSQTTPF